MEDVQFREAESELPLPHKFAMPKVEPHPSDEKLARIHWQQRGKVVAAHTKHLKQLEKTPFKNTRSIAVCSRCSNPQEA